MTRHYLAPLFAAQSIAIVNDHTHIAAGDNAVTQLQAAHFAGDVTRRLVSPAGTALNEPLDAGADLAVVMAAPEAVVAILSSLREQGVRSAIIMNVDSDASPSDVDARDLHRRFGLPVLGPNVLALQRPSQRLVLGSSTPLAAPGSLALLAQSHSIAQAFLHRCQHHHLGISAAITLGDTASNELATALDFFATDGETDAIAIYLEGIADARRFMSALRFAASAKPVFVLKGGGRDSDTRNARHPNGTLATPARVVEAAIRRSGAIQVASFAELAAVAVALTAAHRPAGRRLGVVGDGGGLLVLARDAATHAGLVLSEPSEALSTQLRAAGAPAENPCDLSRQMGSDVLPRCLQAFAASAEFDVVIVAHVEGAQRDAVATARGIVQVAQANALPIIAVWMDAPASDANAAVRRTFREGVVPQYWTMESAVRAVAHLARFSEHQQLLQQTVAPLVDARNPRSTSAQLIVEAALAEHREWLTESEAKALLSAFHIPITQTVLARTPHEALVAAEQIGFPVVAKIASPDIQHKSDVGGVILGIEDAESLMLAFEAINQRVSACQPTAQIDGVTIQAMRLSGPPTEVALGVSNDAVFGPVICFGAGGALTDLIDDQTMELPPLNAFLARRMIERTRIAGTLKARHGDACLDTLAEQLVRVSELVCNVSQIVEIDVNPVIVDAAGVVAVDARVFVQNACNGREAQSRLAILPYPHEFTQPVRLADGTQYQMRAVRAEDAKALQAFVRSLSPESRYFRFVQSIQELPPAMLARYTQLDYDRAMAILALAPDALGERIIGVARYVQEPDGESCEFALVVADAWQGKGVGSRLMIALFEAAKARGYKRMVGWVMASNEKMLRAMSRLGFTSATDAEDASMRIVTRAL